MTVSDVSLRVFDLGDVDGVELAAASDVPAFDPPGSSPCLVMGVVRDHHLSIGYQLPWHHRCGPGREAFTLSRWSILHGMMYCRDVLLCRVWVDESLLAADVLYAVMLQVAIDATRDVVGPDATFKMEGNYTYLNGIKFAGVGHNVIRGRSNCVLYVNTHAIDFDSLRTVFHSKAFDEVGDLAAYDLGPDFPAKLAGCIAKRLELNLGAATFDETQTQQLARLREVHRSDDWVEDGLRDDFEVDDFEVPPRSEMVFDVSSTKVTWVPGEHAAER